MEIANLITVTILSNKLYILPPPLNLEVINPDPFIKHFVQFCFLKFKVKSSQKKYTIIFDRKSSLLGEPLSKKWKSKSS